MSRKIIGVTVGTQLPKPNFKQNDPTKGDYIKNKPDFEGLESRIDTMSNLVGDTKVSDQIANAIVNKVDKVDGQRLITTDEADKLKALVIGENGQVGISGTVNADNVQGLAEKLALKVDKVDGKGLSTNDYTTAEKNKLAAIDTGANKTVVDSALNETSTNPVQNKVVNAAISDLNTLVGNTKVSDQISDALNTHRADMNASMDEPGHIVHRTHYSKYIATLIDNAVINNDIISANRGEFCYNDIKDYDELTVIFDGVVYECPITVKHGEESYFYAGNFQDSAPEYPFYILGYLANESVIIGVGEGEHIVSVKLSEVAKKLDAKYLPDDVVAASDWSAKEGEAGHILNRTHYKETNIVDIVPSGSFTLDEYAYCMTEANGRLVAGKTYVATIDGVKYERVATHDEEFEAAYIGNLEVFWGNESENPDDDAFCFMVAEDGMADISLVSSDYANKTITFSVQEFTEVIHKLPLEYLDMPDMDAAEGKPGHVLNRTHYSEPEVILADNVEITTSGMYSWISYNAIKDYEEITVVYDGTTYVCPITFGIDTTDYDSKYFKFGSWNDAECPFSFVGYETLEYAAVTVPDGSHTLSVMAGEYVKKLDKKYLPDDIGGVTDWNAAEGEPGHIMNRTHYSEIGDKVMVEGEFTTQYIDNFGVFCINVGFEEDLETAPEKATLVYDGVEYDVTFTDIPDLGKVGGNLYHMNALFGTSYEDTGEPFIMGADQFGCMVMTLDTTPTAHTIKVIMDGLVTYKLDIKYLPDDLASVPQTKMDKTDPAGYGSFSMNRKESTPVGEYSHAEGIETTASGYASHAEGTSTTASGDHSHAEGFSTTASDYYSHAEGHYTTASGYAAHAEGSSTTASENYSHAEGIETTASGYASHAEGVETTVSGYASHAEGVGTTASGSYSHAEGYNTIASGNSSHVQGKRNIDDTEHKYAHIVGNGENNTTRSNAHTLDWEGNAWYQGDVYVGSTSGTNRDEGSKKLATEEYVNIRVPAWTDADEGKFLRIVNGTPTWVSIPSAEEASF